MTERREKKCRAVLPPVISVHRAHSNPDPHYHKTTSFIKAYPVYRFITAPCTQELRVHERHKSSKCMEQCTDEDELIGAVAVSLHSC